MLKKRFWSIFSTVSIVQLAIFSISLNGLRADSWIYDSAFLSSLAEFGLHVGSRILDLMDNFGIHYSGSIWFQITFIGIMIFMIAAISFVISLIASSSRPVASE